jgi:hypothetical protein
LRREPEVEAGAVDQDDGIGPFPLGEIEYLIAEPAEFDLLLQDFDQADDGMGREIEELLLSRRRHARAADADDPRARLLLVDGLDEFRAVRIAAGLARDHEDDRGRFGRGRLGSAHG